MSVALWTSVGPSSNANLGGCFHDLSEKAVEDDGYLTSDDLLLAPFGSLGSFGHGLTLEELLLFSGDDLMEAGSDPDLETAKRSRRSQRLVERRRNESAASSTTSGKRSHDSGSSTASERSTRASKRRSRVENEDAEVSGAKRKHPSCGKPAEAAAAAAENSSESDRSVGQSVRDRDLLRSNVVVTEDAGAESDSSEDSTSSSIVMVPTGRKDVSNFWFGVETISS